MFCDDPDCSWGGYGIPHACPLERAEQWIRETAAALDEEKKHALKRGRCEDDVYDGLLRREREQQPRSKRGEKTR